MPNKKKPAAQHQFAVTFKKYGKKYRVNIKIFKTDIELNSYYNSTVSAGYRDPHGILAAAIFDKPERGNRNCIGEMIFSRSQLHPSLIAHESVHMVFQYFEHAHGLDFRTRRREETFCDVIEDLMDGIYIYLKKNRIPYRSFPRWRK